MKKGIGLIAFAFALFMAQNVFAQQDSVWDMAGSDQYGKKVGGMLGRGLVNVATCFVDVIVQTVNGTQDGPPFVGTLTGLGSGIACTALRVTSGALDVITFWVPGFNGIPVSKSYSNCLEWEEEKAPASFSEPEMAAPAAAPVIAPVTEPQSSKRKHNPLDYVKK